MVPFTPRLIPAILPNLAHHVQMIQLAALRTNKLLSNVIQNLPGPVEGPSRQNTVDKSTTFTGSPTPTAQSLQPSRQTTILAPVRDASSPESMGDQPSSSLDKPTAPLTQRPRSRTMQGPTTEPPSRPQSRMSSDSLSGAQPPPPAPIPTPPSPVREEADKFNYQATVNELTIQFLSEHEQTRVAALKWLIMLHQKAPKKVRRNSCGKCTCTRLMGSQILAMDDGTFPALLKTLSDSSEEVLICIDLHYATHSSLGYQA